MGLCHYHSGMTKPDQATSQESKTRLRLTRDHWINAALEVLGTSGVDGIRIDHLARVLKATKGSFYWHFKDREELLVALLDRWRRQNTIDIIEAAKIEGDPFEHLKALARLPFEIEKGDPLGLPLRVWARQDPRARAALEEIDDLRVRMITQIFVAAGFEAKEAKSRAILLYSYMRISSTLVQLKDGELRQQCDAIVLGLPLGGADPK